MVVKQIGLESITKKQFLEKMTEFYENKQYNRFYDLNSQAKKGEVYKLESKLNELFNSKYTLAINSATQGLTIAINSLGIEEAEILVPFYSFSACPLAIINSGNTPRVFNIGDNLDIDIENLKRNVNNNTKAIMLVYMRGITTKYYEEVIKIAKKYNLKVIEDISQFDLAKTDGNLGWGTKGDIAVLSFQSKKIVSGGEGGAILTNDKEIYLNAVKYHDAAWDIRGNSNFDNDEHNPLYPGARMNEITAALINIQLGNLEGLKEKLFNHKYSIENNKANPIVNKNNNGYNVHFIFENKESKDEFLKKNNYTVYPEFSGVADPHSYLGWHKDIKKQCIYEGEKKENIFENNLIIQTPLD